MDKLSLGTVIQHFTPVQVPDKIHVATLLLNQGLWIPASLGHTEISSQQDGSSVKIKVSTCSQHLQCISYTNDEDLRRNSNKSQC